MGCKEALPSEKVPLPQTWAWPESTGTVLQGGDAELGCYKWPPSTLHIRQALIPGTPTLTIHPAFIHRHCVFSHSFFGSALRTSLASVPSSTSYTHLHSHFLLHRSLWCWARIPLSAHLPTRWLWDRVLIPAGSRRRRQVWNNPVVGCPW